MRTIYIIMVGSAMFKDSLMPEVPASVTDPASCCCPAAAVLVLPAAACGLLQFSKLRNVSTV